MENKTYAPYYLKQSNVWRTSYLPVVEDTGIKHTSKFKIQMVLSTMKKKNKIL